MHFSNRLVEEAFYESSSFIMQNHPFIDLKKKEVTSSHLEQQRAGCIYELLFLVGESAQRPGDRCCILGHGHRGRGGGGLE